MFIINLLRNFDVLCQEHDKPVGKSVLLFQATASRNAVDLARFLALDFFEACLKKRSL